MKCKQYWPENGETRLHEYLNLTHIETLEYSDHVERQFEITDTRVSYIRLQNRLISVDIVLLQVYVSS